MRPPFASNFGRTTDSAGSSTKALTLRLDPGDDEAEQKARMGIERRTELEVRRELARVAGELYPPDSEPQNAFTESVRAAEAVTGERMRDILSRALQDSADLGVSVSVRQFENVGFGFDYTLANENARDWALRYTDDLLAQLGTTTSRIVGQAVGRWINNGEPLQALVRDLRPAFGAQRAKLIASTEVTRAYAQGSKEAYVASGVVKKLVWQASMDERVCIYCGSLHGKVVGIEESFDDALPDKLKETTRPFALPPGHPGCILPGNLISAPGGIDAMAKSFYVGKCVEITLSDGRKLTITKNHPILTPSGWVAAQFLSEGMYIFSTIDSDRIATAINPDNQDVPTAIEQVFDSFVKSGVVGTVSVPPAAENLHGEGDCVKGNIDIVYANRLLLGDSVPQRSKIVGEDTFREDNAGLSHLLGLGISGTLVRGHLAPLGNSVGLGEHGIPTSAVSSCPARGHSLGATARADTEFEEPTPERVAIDTNLCAERFLGFSSEIPINVGVNAGDVLSYAAKIDASRLQSPRDGTDIDIKLASEFLRRFAGEIATSQITGIRHFDYSGHVYDLQSDMHELYICNGVIVKNCRCWVSAQIEEPKQARKPKPKPAPKPVVTPPLPPPLPPIVVPPPPVIVTESQPDPLRTFENIPDKHRRKVQRYIDAQVRETAEEYNVSEAEVRQELERITADLTDARNPVAIRLPSEVIDKIMDSGRIKSQFETRTSEIIVAIKERGTAELRGMGYERKSPPEQRPIYGFVDDPRVSRSANMYGDIQFELKPEVRQRTTVTIGDSLEGLHRGWTIPTPINDMGSSAYGEWVATYYGAATGRYRWDNIGLQYVEVQIHGQVKMSDIARVRDTENRLSDAQIRRLNTLGIEVLDGGGYVVELE